MENKDLKLWIQKWRNSHEGSGWHESECCAMEAMDELERLVYLDEKINLVKGLAEHLRTRLAGQEPVR